MNISKAYLRKFKRALMLPRKERKKYTAIIEELIGEYILANPSAAYSDLVRCCGSPERQAQRYITADRLEAIRRSYKHRLLVTFVSIAILLFGLIGVGVWAIILALHTDVDTTVKIVVGLFGI